MSGKPRKIYWDTCVFLAWIKQERDWPEDVMKGIEQAIDEWRSGRLVIVTSALTLLEVQSAQLSKDHRTAFAKAFGHPGLQLVDLDRRVSGKASHIREYYDDRVFGPDGSTKSGRIIGLGDAVHLATALHIGVSEFQTLDGAGRRKRKFNLLKLDGDVAGARLSIKIPKFIPPPEPLKGPPAPTISGVQPKLWEEADEKANTQATEPVTPYLRGGGDRHSESIAATTHEADEIKGGQSSEEEKQLEAIDAEFPPPGIADDDDAEMAQLEDWFDEQVMAVPVDTDPTEEEPE